MAVESIALVALCRGIAQAEETLDHLTSEGFSSESVSVLLRDTPAIGHVSGTLGLLAGLGRADVGETSRFLAAGPLRKEIETGGGSASPEAVTKADLGCLLRSLGVGDASVDRLAASIRGGGVLLCLHTGTSGDNVNRASRIVNDVGAENIPLTAAPFASDRDPARRPQWQRSDRASEGGEPKT